MLKLHKDTQVSLEKGVLQLVVLSTAEGVTQVSLEKGLLQIVVLSTAGFGTP